MPVSTPTKRFSWKYPGPGFRGFTLQFFLITILPLTVLLLVVAFGSQTLHHEAMRSLVGDRDLKAVRAAAGSLERELSHRASTIGILARSLNGQSNFSNLLLTPEEQAAEFDGGLALYSSDGKQIAKNGAGMDWGQVAGQMPGFLEAARTNPSNPVFSKPFSLTNDERMWVLVGSLSGKNEVLAGAFTPANLIQNAVNSLVSAGQTTVLVVSAGGAPGEVVVLFRGGPEKTDETIPTHPGIRQALAGESGINYFQSGQGEHVVAFSPVRPVEWGLVIEEAWEDIASPYLSTTQSAPLVIVPVFLLALLALWFGASRIVRPLQELERKAGRLAGGDFEPIHEPVGGIEEIRSLQEELVDMADKLRSAQQGLRNYIGAITAGIENERRSLARELHDDTIQSLIALNQRIQMALLNAPEDQKIALGELHSLVQQTMTDLRRTIKGLRPIYLEDIGLVPSLEMLVRETSQTIGFPISFTVDGRERRLDAQVEMLLYRMVQESLNNVVHHSRATQAGVELHFSEAGLGTVIRDNGVGFTPPADPADFSVNGHFGLLGIKERSEMIGAELKIQSVLGKGTTITILISGQSLTLHESQ